MPRGKASSGQLKQQSLTGFLKPNPSKANNPRNPKSRTKPGPTRLPRRIPPQLSEPSDQSGTDSDVEAIHFEPKEVIISDDDDIQPSSPVRRRRTVIEVDSHPNHGTPTSSDSDDNVGTSGRAMPSVKIRRNVSRSPSIGHESPPKRRRLARVRPSSPEESDDNLLDEVNEADIIQSRFRNRQKRTTFQTRLNDLKKKKLGLKLSESSDEQANDDEVISDQDSQQEDGDGSNSDNDTDDFVVQDDGSVIPDLPVAFSRHSHQDTRHDFKVVCQLFVHLAMMPMDERRAYMEEMLKDEHYFSVPFQVIRRKISGTRDSIASSVWRRDFKGKLERYPDLTMMKLDFAVPHCDACHLGGRQSTVTGWLKGIPYDNLSFEPMINESDSEDLELEDENANVTSFSLGRFCAARAQIFHRLSHWNYHLYRTLSEEIDLAQQPRRKRAYDTLGYARNLPPPKDTSNPDEVMEWLDRRGTVSAEWQKLRELLERASNLDASAGKREEDINLDM